jgi:hypothetical protein
MEEQGIMSLGGMGAPAPANQPPMFDPAASAAFESARQQIDPREFGTELLAAAEDTDPVEVQRFRQALDSAQLPPEIIDALGQMVDAVLAEPQNYQEIRAEFIKEGVPEELLPPEFDAAYFGALNMALDQMSGSMMPMGVQGFAEGGIVQLNPIAQALASQGRNGDRMLAHITPAEARMLRRRGGSGTINPVTGLPEFFFKSVAKAVGGAFKSVGKAIGGAVKGIAGAIKSFAKSSVGKIVTAVALGFFLGPAAAAQFGITSAAGVAAVSGFVGGFGSSLLAGQSLKDSLKSGALGGLTAGVTAGVTGGMGAFEAKSYAGPTTISGQWDRAVESGKSLLGMPSAQPEVAGNLANVEVSPVQAPTAPTVTELAGQPIAGPQDFLFDPITGEQLLTPAVSSPVVAAPPALTTPIAPASQTFALPGGPQGFSFDPVTGEMLTNAAPIGPGTGITSLPTPSVGDYLSTADAQNLLASGAATPTVPFPAGPDYMSTSDYQNLITSGQGIPTPAASEQALGGGIRVPGSYTTPRLSAMGPTTGGIGTLPGSPAATGFQQAPSAMDLYRQGDYFGAAKEAFMPTSYTNQQLIQSPNYQQYVQAGFKPTEALQMASKDLNPSFIRSYGPTVAAGTLALGAMGGPQQPEAPGIVPKETGFDLLAQSPEIYGTTPGGAATQYFTPPYMGYGLPRRQYIPPRFMFSPMQYYAAPQQTMSPQGYAEGGIVSTGSSRYRPAEIFFDTEQNQYVTRNPVYSPEIAQAREALAKKPLKPGFLASAIQKMQETFLVPSSYEYVPFSVSGATGTTGTTAKPFFTPGGGRTVYAPYSTENLAGTAGLSVSPAPMFAAQGGIATLRKGGTPEFPRKNGAINGPGTATSDSIPAMLSDGEFVFTAKAVRGMGKGSRRLGAKRMYAMMKALEGKA